MSTLAVLAAPLVASLITSVRTGQLRYAKHAAPAYVGKHRGSAS